jgi:hypothetical protein
MQIFMVFQLFSKMNIIMYNSLITGSCIFCITSRTGQISTLPYIALDVYTYVYAQFSYTHICTVYILQRSLVPVIFVKKKIFNSSSSPRQIFIQTSSSTEGIVKCYENHIRIELCLFLNIKLLLFFNIDRKC